ncbi:uncharacterized protein [Blastocystis hominis]|uniref:Uncharacterized protein n=1 Tax=Blastocystis hominis TaxID=12968 RepID=D8MBP4_BLAHO|nr:uncharacterized protein [Blastocystis hominis]CBK25483.2 unnamed protein product [Blastocystis hominis]|eukprot:XP_012899531.1 uncharacterized protein [Blastocystis hominis]
MAVQESVPVPVSTPEQKPEKEIVNDVDTSLAILEARCKRFGIPFDPEKHRPKAQTVQAPQRQQNNYSQKLLERRKRFGATTTEEEKKNQRKQDNNKKKKERENTKQPASNRRMFSGMSEEEKSKMEARMKRFGLSVQ